MYVHMCMICSQRPEKALNPLEVELKMVVSYQVGAGN